MTHILALTLFILHSSPGTPFYENDATVYDEAHYFSVADACVHESWGHLDPFTCAAMGYHESRWNPKLGGPELPTGQSASGMLQVILPYAKRAARACSQEDVYTVNGSVWWGSVALEYFVQREGADVAVCHYGGGKLCAKNYERVVFWYKKQIENLYVQIQGSIGAQCTEDVYYNVASIN